MTLKRQAVLFFATGCWIGKLPWAPGTFGSLLGLALCQLIEPLRLTGTIFFILFFIAFSVWIAHEAEKIIARKDPGSIVIDEICGILITFSGIPFHLTTVIAGFILFRLLDITKPFPIRYADKKLPGGVGIVADDVMAGLVANVFLRVAVNLIGPQ
jgi:phosphatidylglycerophosphatase A